MATDTVTPKENENFIDSSDEEELRNTIGNVPLKWYEDYDHIGYDLDAKKISKPKQTNADRLDEFIQKMEDENYGRTVIDTQTGESIVLTDEDIKIIKHLSESRLLNKEVNDYEIEYSRAFMKDTVQTALSGRPEHKRSFIPSKWEKLQVGKYVHAIKMGWIKAKEPKETQYTPKFYNLWDNEKTNDLKRYLHRLPAPKVELPGHEASYNPPPEYLLDESEIKQRKEKDEENEKRQSTLIPKKYTALRLVPAYDKLIDDQFNRCLDMYLCPRQMKMKVQVNPDDLIPKLPKPKDLQPFPTQLSIVYKGHTDVINSISVHSTGQWLISGSNDNTIKFWEISTSRCLKTIKLNAQVKFVSWVPIETLNLILILSENNLILLNAKLGDKLVINSTDSKINEFNLAFNQISDDIEDENHMKNHLQWKFFNPKENNELYKDGYRIQITHQKNLKHASWHQKGDYFVSVSDDKTTAASVIIHQLSKQKSIIPFAKMKGIVQQVKFHPLKPILFVATQRYIKIYDLIKQSLIKKLLTNCNWISSFDVHSGGDNLIMGGYDNRLTWFDLDLSSKPYKTLKYHKKAIRDVKYHKRYPLFASTSDDGTAIVCHGMVYNDLTQNPLIVPLKILRTSEMQKSVPVRCCEFHPLQPWLFTGGNDQTIKLFTN